MPATFESIKAALAERYAIEREVGAGVPHAVHSVLKLAMGFSG